MLVTQCSFITFVANDNFQVNSTTTSTYEYKINDEDKNRQGNYGMKFAWPCKPRCKIVKDFQQLSSKYASGVRGIKLNMKNAQPVYVPYDGQVFYKGIINGVNIISIKHNAQIRSTFSCVKSSHSKNDLVHKGEVLGEVDYSNCDPQLLHFGVIKDKDTYLDPKKFLRSKIVLLPIL